MQDNAGLMKVLRKTLKIILILAAALIIGAAVFSWFRMRANARIALRDAKDLRNAMGSVDTELYAINEEIFDPAGNDGFYGNSEKKALKLADCDGDAKLLSYDSRMRRVTSFTYETGSYVVTYKYDPEDPVWTVDYRLRVLDYRGEDIY